MGIALLVVRLLAGLLLVLDAYGKTSRPLSENVAVVRQYGVPDSFSPLVAAALPGVEMLVGATLLLGFYPALAFPAAALLYLLFAAAVTRRLLTRVERGDCGCFGGRLNSRIGWPLVARNGVLTVFLLVGSFTDAVSFASAKSLGASPASYLFILGASAVFVANYLLTWRRQGSTAATP